MSHENNLPYILIGLISVLLIVSIFQTVTLVGVNSKISNLQLNASSSSSSSGTPVQSSLSLEGIDIIPKGTNPVWGKELGIAYDDITPTDPNQADATIKKLSKYDTDIKLEGDLLKRYIETVSQISCEYCCGAATIIFTEDNAQYKAGDPACGCAHSYAMRGLAKYLLTNHADTFTNEMILEELGKLKTLFFPDQIIEKAAILKSKNIELTYANMTSNKYRDIKADVQTSSSSSSSTSSSGSGMVGGC